MRAFLALLLFGIVALAAGLAGYQAGLTASAASAGATVVVTGGFPGLGFLFFVLLLGALLVAASPRRRRAPWVAGPGMSPWMGRGHWGRHDGSTDPGDPRHAWLANLHRSLHEADAAGATNAPASSAGAPGGPDGATGLDA